MDLCGCATVGRETLEAEQKQPIRQVSKVEYTADGGGMGMDNISHGMVWRFRVHARKRKAGEVSGKILCAKVADGCMIKITSARNFVPVIDLRKHLSNPMKQRLYESIRGLLMSLPFRHTYNRKTDDQPSNQGPMPYETYGKGKSKQKRRQPTLHHCHPAQETLCCISSIRKERTFMAACSGWGQKLG